VFESNNKNEDWNGWVNNHEKPCPDGTYYYILRVRYKDKVEEEPVLNGIIRLFALNVVILQLGADIACHEATFLIRFLSALYAGTITNVGIRAGFYGRQQPQIPVLFPLSAQA
jgi:hypothetical protein